MAALLRFPRRRSWREDARLTFARLITADSRAALNERLSSYLDPRLAARACDAAEAAVLVVDEPPRAAFDVCELLEERGAFGHATQGRLVVVARRSVLDEARSAADEEGRVLIDELVRALDAAAGRVSSVRLRDVTLEVGGRAAVMGILNVTPDSFYDRGRYSALDAARARAVEMVEQGAALLDIGGQSYAAWNETVDEAEEQGRVVPVVRALLADGLGVPLSIDTFRASVAEAALDAGAHLINDCSGLSDPRLARVVAAFDAGLVVMHIKGVLNVRERDYVYDDALREIITFLHERCERAVAAGVSRASILVDPGLEFGKEPRTDLEILERFGELRSLGLPILFAASRKSFIGRIFNRPASDLLVPSLATAAIGIAAGAAMIRVHDVPETVQLAAMMAAVRPQNRNRLQIRGAAPSSGSK